MPQIGNLTIRAFWTIERIDIFATINLGNEITTYWQINVVQLTKNILTRKERILPVTPSGTSIGK